MDLLGLPKLPHPCEECALSGIRHSRQSTQRAVPVPARNYRWGCNIVGKFHATTKDPKAKQYAPVVVDYHTNFCWIRTMKQKSETLTKFKQIVHEAKLETWPDSVIFGTALQEMLYCSSAKIKKYLCPFLPQVFLPNCEQTQTLYSNLRLLTTSAWQTAPVSSTRYPAINSTMGKWNTLLGCSKRRCTQF